MTNHVRDLLSAASRRLAEWPGSSLLLALWQAADEGMHSERTRRGAMALFAACELATCGSEASALVGLVLAAGEVREAA